MGLERVQKCLRIDPDMTLRIDPQTGPELTLRSLISRPQISHTWNKALFDLFITFADIKQEPSKDWIRAPSQCQE